MFSMTMVIEKGQTSKVLFIVHVHSSGVYLLNGLILREAIKPFAGIKYSNLLKRNVQYLGDMLMIV